VIQKSGFTKFFGPSLFEFASSMRLIRWVAFCLLVLIGIVLARSLTTRTTGTKDHSVVPLDRSAYLRDVVEPIVMVQGVSWDDNSQGVVFEDLRRTEKSVCLLFLEADDEPQKRNLLLGSSVPNPRYGKRVPVGGSEEQAFLGLLERWYRSDAEAREIDRRITEKTTEPFADMGKTDEYYGKVIAVRILRILRRRN
jgi:hypothetical protein